MDNRRKLKAANNDHTRERILDEAESLFALKGYDAVSVREITGAANCNLAAVNYHFGNKRNLYLEVFRSRWL
ncbi:MAG: TetR family transcriptional regulator, partial [Desulfobacterales bacterium]